MSHINAVANIYNPLNQPEEVLTKNFVVREKEFKIIFNEIVNIPKNLAAIAKPRSSLLRCGATIETAVWDAGYSGRSESLLVVYNEKGFRVKKNARLLQLLFFRLDGEVKKGYSGIYQNENIVK